MDSIRMVMVGMVLLPSSMNALAKFDLLRSGGRFESTASFNVSSSSCPVLLEIPEGTTQEIQVVYAPENAGLAEGVMTLHTNDPTNATIEIALTAVSISEVSGEVCDINWTLINLRTPS